MLRGDAGWPSQRVGYCNPRAGRRGRRVDRHGRPCTLAGGVNTTAASCSPAPWRHRGLAIGTCPARAQYDSAMNGWDVVGRGHQSKRSAMRMRSARVLAALLAVGAMPLAAQQSRSGRVVVGTVTDSVTGASVEGATVTFEHVGRTAFTDDEGAFRI